LDAINCVICSGLVGVDLFFVLSGFLITSLLIKEKSEFGNISFRLFFTRRMLRIWPLYYTTLVSSVVIVTLFAMFGNASRDCVFSQLWINQFLPLALFVGNFSFIFNEQSLLTFCKLIDFPIYTLLLPFWSLCIEEQFYIFWPLTIKLAPTLKTLVFGLCAAIVGTVFVRILLQALSSHIAGLSAPVHFYYFNTFSHLDPILIGCLLSISFYTRPQSFQIFKKHGIFVFAALSLGAFFLFRSMPMHILTNSPRMVWDMFFTAILCATTLALVLVWQPAKRLFSHPILINIGRLTFAMYVFHDLVLTLIGNMLPDVVPPSTTLTGVWLIKILLAYPCTYLLALISWKLLEKRFLNLRKRYSRTSLRIRASD
jgi:peptidoglycan/LPS O-acetylase OafA/YrhL